MISAGDMIFSIIPPASVATSHFRGNGASMNPYALVE